tara:strand:+ start:1140 stop:1292 length:153 start_codon:yes stop_codon:yes gene_type:complete
MKWLGWEKDPKKESGSSEWKPILKFWIYAAIIISVIFLLIGVVEAPFKIS